MKKDCKADCFLCAESPLMALCARKLITCMCVYVCVCVTLRRCKAFMLFMAQYYLSVLSSDRHLYGTSSGFAT